MIELETTQPQTPFKILLIGDDCLDVYQFGTVDRISPEAPVPVFKLGNKEERPGMARNVKINLEELGCFVAYMQGRTSVKTRYIDSRSRQQIIRIDNDNRSEPISTIDIELDLFDAVVLSDYDKGTLNYSNICDLINKASAKKIPIFIDTKKTDLQQFQGAWVKINELEYSRVVSECSGLIVTKGAKGAEAKHHEISVSSPKVEVVDVCGAGDTFLAAFTVQWLYTKDIEKSLYFANIAAGLTVQNLGCYAPSYDEIRTKGY